MKVLIRQAKIIFPGSTHHLSVKDILISDGIISDISERYAGSADREIHLPGLHASPGWLDIFTSIPDPGYEYREDLMSGASAAAAGGFTDLMLIPNTQPCTGNKSQVEYLKQRSQALPVNIHPIASVSKDLKGLELAEMYDLHDSGATAFSDGIQSIQQAGLLLKALQYVKAINRVIIQLPDDKNIQPQGLMNEGTLSTRLGLPGRPGISEELMLARDIELLKYTGSRLHVTGISTAKSVQLINNAKKEGLDITCSATPYHCLLDENEINTYNTHMKVNPPLRGSGDAAAIRDAVKSGIIDCISSHHMPYHNDEKDCEFEKSASGMAGLESAFGAINSFLNDPSAAVQLLAIRPREIFRLQTPQITTGAGACLTLFNPDATFVFNENMIRSKSRNHGFLGKELKGKVLGIINKNQIVLNNP